MFIHPGGLMHTICFIDDDQHELDRFRNSLAGRFNIVTGRSLQEVAESANTVDLFVLDMYFPSIANPTKERDRIEMNHRHAELTRRINEFKGFLASIGQECQGGFDLFERIKGKAPAVFFTRKGFLDDAHDAQARGVVAVLLKPTPPQLPEHEADMQKSLDAAFDEIAPQLADKFDEIIRANSWWNRHWSKVTFVLGVVAGEAVGFGLVYLFGLTL
jgi:CheY-like chemotaxis protein